MSQSTIHAGLKRAAIMILNFLRTYINDGKVRLKRLMIFTILKWRYDADTHTPDIIYVNTDRIKYYQLNTPQTNDSMAPGRDFSVPIHKLEKGRFNPVSHTGIILPGDWDLHKKRYKFDRVYQGLRDHYLNSEDWENTEYWQSLIIRDTLREDGRSTEYRKKANERLYESIRQQGVLTPTQSGDKRPKESIYTRPWNITVNIGRDGKLIFNNNAHHRLAIAKIVELDKIPVCVTVRHKKWQEIREEIKTRDEQDLDGELKEYLEHPDVTKGAEQDERA